MATLAQGTRLDLGKSRGLGLTDPPGAIAIAPIIIDLCTPPPSDHKSAPKSMAIPEDDILKPKDPSLHNSDDWPTFNLKKISVTSSKTGEQVSLLSAHKGHPVIVSGKLEKVDNDLLPLSMMNYS